MKPLPDLEDAEAMILRGRRSVLASARNDALEELRDAYTAIQSDPIENMRTEKIIKAAERLAEISKLWK
jgi:hypothetical protein